MTGTQRGGRKTTVFRPSEGPPIARLQEELVRPIVPRDCIRIGSQSSAPGTFSATIPLQFPLRHLLLPNRMARNVPLPPFLISDLSPFLISDSFPFPLSNSLPVFDPTFPFRFPFRFSLRSSLPFPLLTFSSTHHSFCPPSHYVFDVIPYPFLFLLSFCSPISYPSTPLRLHLCTHHLQGLCTLARMLVRACSRRFLSTLLD